MRVCLLCGEVYPAGETICAACESLEEALLDWDDANTELRSAVGTNPGAEDGTDVGTLPGVEDPTVVEVVAAKTPSAPIAEALPEDATPIISRSGVRSTGPDATACVPREGRLLDGRYLLGKRIGIGGYGAVFAATDERLQKRVAVKVLSPAVAQHPTALTRFRQEAIAASRVQHENIVEIFDFCVDPSGLHFIVMEFLDGMDLAQIIREEGHVDPERALRIVSQCAGGLAEVHGVGILHRDLKPSNIFLSRRPEGEEIVKIIDFGISKIIRGRGHVGELTSASAKVGTPYYMAPEQAQEADPSGKSDVYSLGVILFELLTGDRPYEGRSPLDIMEKHLNSDRVAPSSIQASLEGRLAVDQLVMSCMALGADDRPTMRALERESRALAALQADVVVENDEGDVTGLHGIAASAAVRVDARAPRQGRRPSQRGRQALWAASIAIALLLLAIVATRPSREGEASISTPDPLVGAAAHPPAEPPPAEPDPNEAEPDPSEVAVQEVVPDLSEVAAQEAPSVELRSSPAGASVFLGGKLIGTTPMKLDARGEETELEFRLRGMRMQQATVRPSHAAEGLAIEFVAETKTNAGGAGARSEVQRNKQGSGKARVKDKDKEERVIHEW